MNCRAEKKRHDYYLTLGEVLSSVANDGINFGTKYGAGAFYPDVRRIHYQMKLLKAHDDAVCYCEKCCNNRVADGVLDELL